MSSDIDKSVDRLGFEPAGVVPLGGYIGIAGGGCIAYPRKARM